MSAPTAAIAAVTTSTFFLPYRSASLVISGVATPPTSVNAVMTQITCVVPNSSAIFGSVGAIRLMASADCSVRSTSTRITPTQ